MFLLAPRRLLFSMARGTRAAAASKPRKALRCSIRTVMGKSSCIRMEPSMLQTGDFRKIGLHNRCISAQNDYIKLLADAPEQPIHGMACLIPKVFQFVL